MNQNPEWRPVPGWPEYSVSENGDVRSERANCVLKPWRLKNGRWQVKLCVRGVAKAFFTYRLVALAFLGPPPFEGAEVGHRNDNKDQNWLANLKWCSHQENCDDRSANGKAAVGDRNGARTMPEKLRRGVENNMAVLTERDIIEIRAQPTGGKALAARYGVTYTNIKFIRARKTWRHVA